MRVLKSGPFLLISAALLFSTGGMLIKLLSDWPALAINCVRGCTAGSMIFLYMRATGMKLKVNKGTLLCAFCVSTTTNLFIFANKLTTAANTILLQYASPIFIILFMWLIFRERPRRLDIITCFFILTGIIFFVMDGLESGRMLGNILALIAALTFSGVFLMNRIPGGDSYSSAFMGQICSGMIGMPVFVAQRHFDLRSVLLLLALGVFQMGLGYLFFCAGIKKTAPVSASLITGVEPIMNPLLVALVVGEMISPVSAVGGVIVLGSVTVYNVLLARAQPAPHEIIDPAEEAPEPLLRQKE